MWEGTGFRGLCGKATMGLRVATETLLPDGVLANFLSNESAFEGAESQGAVVVPLELEFELVARDRRCAVLLNAGPTDSENESSLDRKRKLFLIMISFVSAVV